MNKREREALDRHITGNYGEDQLKGSPPTLDQVMAAVQEDDNIGFCMNCGEETRPVEPDAKNYECECCGANQVFGAEELLLRLAP